MQRIQRGRYILASGVVAVSAVLVADTGLAQGRPGRGRPAQPPAEPPAEPAPVPKGSRPDVRSQYEGDASEGFVVWGAEVNSFSGSSVSSAGDLNGDGIDDFVVGASGSQFDLSQRPGAAYVLFGRQGASPPSLDLLSLWSGDGSEGFVVVGAGTDSHVGASVASAGDVNADGVDDLLIGGSAESGVHVVFGRAGGGFPGTLDLEDLADGVDGFALSNSYSSDKGNYGVAGAGDINADGVDDIIVMLSTRAFVVFGRADGEFPPRFELGTLHESDGNDGFVLFDSWAYNRYRERVQTIAGGGDVNNDGVDDLIIGSPDRNRAYVFFGRADSGFLPEFDLRSLERGDGSTGFTILGVSAPIHSSQPDLFHDNCGISVAIAGDVNADGIDDLLIGAPWADDDPAPNYAVREQVWHGLGYAYVVYGSDAGFPPIFELSSIDGQNGFAITGAYEYVPLTTSVVEYGNVGQSVAAAGDVNGDGIDDLIVGATRFYRDSGYREEHQRCASLHSSTNTTSGGGGSSGGGSSSRGGRTSGVGSTSGGGATGGDPNVKDVASQYITIKPANAAYVVFGSRDGFPASITAESADGFAIYGGGDRDSVERFGLSVAAAGDVNGDGLGDVIVGAPFWQCGFGRSEVMFGRLSMGDLAAPFGQRDVFDLLAFLRQVDEGHWDDDVEHWYVLPPFDDTLDRDDVVRFIDLLSE